MSISNFSSTGSTAAADPQTLSHNPLGTARAVVVALSHHSTAVDSITSVSYGTTAMSRVTSAQNASGGVSRSYLYFLGTSIPSGTQTVSVKRSNSTTSMRLTVMTWTADSDTTVLASAITASGLGANPFVDFASSTTTMVGVGVILSARNATSDLVEFSTLTRADSYDFGADVGVVSYQTVPHRSAFSFGYTASADDFALSALVFSQTTADAAGGSVVTYTQAARNAFRLPPVPQAISSPRVLHDYLVTIVGILNAEGYISKFSAADPNTSGLTGLPGNLAVNVGSASTWTRLWVMGGGAASLDTNGWQMVRMA